MKRSCQVIHAYVSSHCYLCAIYGIIRAFHNFRVKSLKTYQHNLNKNARTKYLLYSLCYHATDIRHPSKWCKDEDNIKLPIIVKSQKLAKAVTDNHKTKNDQEYKPANWYEIYNSIIYLLPSVLWHSWLGDRKGIRPVKNRVVGCWHGYLSGAMCRFAYGPADATATHCLLLQ